MTGMTRCVRVCADARLLLLMHTHAVLTRTHYATRSLAPHRVVIVQDVNITQKYQELLRKLEAIGGQKIGRHVVHCRLFNRKTTTGARSERGCRLAPLLRSRTH